MGIFQSSIADDESEVHLKLLGLTKKTFSDYEDCNHDDRPRSGKMYIVQGGKQGAETPLDDNALKDPPWPSDDYDDYYHSLQVMSDKF